MRPDEFNKIVDDMTDKIKATLKRKATEYNLDEDRLSVFKRAAKLQHQTAPQALLGMMTKHIVSIYDYIEDNVTFTKELATEKITDALNYLILLYALLAEDNFGEEKK